MKCNNCGYWDNNCKDRDLALDGYGFCNLKSTHTHKDNPECENHI